MIRSRSSPSMNCLPEEVSPSDRFAEVLPKFRFQRPRRHLSAILCRIDLITSISSCQRHVPLRSSPSIKYFTAWTENQETTLSIIEISREYSLHLPGRRPQQESQWQPSSPLHRYPRFELPGGQGRHFLLPLSQALLPGRCN